MDAVTALTRRQRARDRADAGASAIRGSSGCLRRSLLIVSVGETTSLAAPLGSGSVEAVLDEPRA